MMTLNMKLITTVFAILGLTCGCSSMNNRLSTALAGTDTARVKIIYHYDDRDKEIKYFTIRGAEIEYVKNQLLASNGSSLLELSMTFPSVTVELMSKDGKPIGDVTFVSDSKVILNGDSFILKDNRLYNHLILKLSKF